MNNIIEICEQRLSTKVKEFIDKPISREEVNKATFSLGKPKALESDGFQVGFIKIIGT